MEEFTEGAPTSADSDSDKYITFSLDDEEYGVEVLKVHEIIGYRQFTKVPNVPPFVKGALNLRGLVVPVVDLRLKLNMEPRQYDSVTVVLIMEVQQQIVGIVVDAVSEVVTLNNEDMQQTPDFTSGVQVDFIKGVGRKDGQLLIILDIDRVLSSRELELLDIA